MKGFKRQSAFRVAGLALLVALGSTSLVQAAMRGKFDDADANHDGRVTLSEYQAYVSDRLGSANGRIARRFKKLSPEEQADRIKQRFDKKDRDHKGYLDRNDWGGQ